MVRRLVIPGIRKKVGGHPRHLSFPADGGRGEHRKDKGVAILDYALGNRPSTGGIERMAALTSNREVRANFAELAQQWRDLARQHQNLGNPPPQSN